MNALSVMELNFTYPGAENKALEDISLTLNEGEVLCLCGRTGCGKSTFLRMLKPLIAPHGTLTGQIRFFDKNVREMTPAEQAGRIGFVMQDPDNQIVTDKVWHELAFGLENLGIPPDMIRLRVAETAGFFGIENWFERNTGELSGGQKQILALASVMVTDPELLILDEPTARLDPVAAGDFLSALEKINREMGTTIVIAEHRLDEVLRLADRIAVLDRGKLILEDKVRGAVQTIINDRKELLPVLPMAARAFAAVSQRMGLTDSDPARGSEEVSDAPLDAAEGRAWISSLFAGEGTRVKCASSIDDKDVAANDSKPVSNNLGAENTGIAANSDRPGISIKNVWFRYRKSDPDVIKGLSLKVRRGESIALIGGNGAGKSTLLSLISGTMSAYRGKVRVIGSCSRLPQDPWLLFTEDLVEDDLARKAELSRRANVSPETELLKKLFAAEELYGRHPFDLSGGEQQRLALCEVLSSGADIFLLDEPTKGLDAGYKNVLIDVIAALGKKGKTVVTVSHDTEFSLRAANRCLMMFQGNIIADGRVREFFSGNSFYTTQVNRMARHIWPGALLPEDISVMSEK